MMANALADSGTREIALRVLTAALLVPVGLGAVYAGGWFIALLTALFAGVGAAEWVAMSWRGSRQHRNILFAIFISGAVASACAGLFGLHYVALASLLTGIVVAGVLANRGEGLRVQVFGALYTTLPFGAFVWLRDANEEGFVWALAVLLIVWATDIAAYFAGRGFGGPLLSPLDSPSKTWTGAIGAVVCAALAGASIARVGNADLFHWVFASAVVSVVAQGGDLLESRFKRQFGVKDSSGVIPGHGGVLDRVDSLMASVVLVVLVVQFAPGLVPVLNMEGGL